MAPVDGGNFQGIDPSMLQQLIKSLSSGVTGAQPVASSYIGQFNRVGLDTGPIQKLLADYAWASQQQPMLNRRYSLASHQPSGDFTDGWTEEGAGTLFYTTTAAAKGAGTADAKQMQAYLDAHDWTGIQKELDAMSQNGDDADYMAAFFSQLGPKGLYALSEYAQGGPSSDAANEQEVQQIVGSGLAAASFEMPLTMNFLQGMEPENPVARVLDGACCPAAGTPRRSPRSSPRARSAASGCRRSRPPCSTRRTSKRARRCPAATTPSSPRSPATRTSRPSSTSRTPASWTTT